MLLPWRSLERGLRSSAAYHSRVGLVCAESRWSGRVGSCDRPHEACEFARDGRHRHWRLLSSCLESLESSRQPQVGLATHVGNHWWLLREHLPLSRRDLGVMAVRPRGLDQDAPHATIASLGDATTSLPLSARMLTRY